MAGSLQWRQGQARRKLRAFRNGHGDAAHGERRSAGRKNTDLGSPEPEVAQLRSWAETGGSRTPQGLGAVAEQQSGEEKIFGNVARFFGAVVMSPPVAPSVGMFSE